MKRWEISLHAQSLLNIGTLTTQISSVSLTRITLRCVCCWFLSSATFLSDVGKKVQVRCPTHDDVSAGIRDRAKAIVTKRPKAKENDKAVTARVTIWCVCVHVI